LTLDHNVCNISNIEQTLQGDYMISENIKQTIERYTEERLQPGSFITAVLSNDLIRACECADENNKHEIFNIVKYLYNNVPSQCWGSEERVKRWLNYE